MPPPSAIPGFDAVGFISAEREPCICLVVVEEPEGVIRFFHLLRKPLGYLLLVLLLG